MNLKIAATHPSLSEVKIASFASVEDAKRALQLCQSAYGLLAWNADEHVYQSADKQAEVSVYGDASAVSALRKAFKG